MADPLLGPVHPDIPLENQRFRLGSIAPHRVERFHARMAEVGHVDGEDYVTWHCPYGYGWMIRCRTPEVAKSAVPISYEV